MHGQTWMLKRVIQWFSCKNEVVRYLEKEQNYIQECQIDVILVQEMILKPMKNVSLVWLIENSN